MIQCWRFQSPLSGHDPGTGLTLKAGWRVSLLIMRVVTELLEFALDVCRANMKWPQTLKYQTELNSTVSVSRSSKQICGDSNAKTLNVANSINFNSGWSQLYFYFFFINLNPEREYLTLSFIFGLDNINVQFCLHASFSFLASQFVSLMFTHCTLVFDSSPLTVCL